MDYISLSKKADQKLRLRECEDAKKLLEEGLSLAKKNRNKSFVEFFLGELQILNGNYEIAISHYKKAVDLTKKGEFKAFFHKNLGVSLSKLGREEEAIEQYKLALVFKPKDYDSLRNLGVSLSKLEREEEAIEQYRLALEIEPEDYVSLRNLGVSLSNLGRDEEAIEQYKSAIRIKPDDYDSLRDLGISLNNLGRDKEAIEQYKSAVKMKPDDYNSLIYLGISLSNLGRDEEAIEQYKSALTIKPEDYDSLINLGISLIKLGRDEEAIEQYKSALEIKPNDHVSLRNIGVSLIKLGREEEAIEQYGHGLKSEDWRNLVTKAFTLENIGKEEEAARIFASILRNESKVKDEEIIEIVNYKKNALLGKKLGGKTDILNRILDEVINATQRQQKGDFFRTINNIEHRFMKFIDSERSIQEDFFSFLSVLRKWNSYTPILPSKKGDNKGGGYFLFHRGKGIVIDPGFNFIENFYQEGFKVADIDAVLITHAHNDHTVDLESILTLVYKHNDAIKDCVIEEMQDKTEDERKHEIEKRLKETGKKIDLFMNVGTFMKYSGWLNLKDSSEINYVTVLMPNTEYKLPAEYKGITIYTTKAKHHEIIDEQYAIGFILDIDGVKVGFTGDSGWDWDRGEIMVKPFKDLKPQLIVAHLGSIKRKEFDYVKFTSPDERNKCFYSHHLGLLGITRFIEETKPKLTIISEFGEELRDKRQLIVESIDKVLNENRLPEEKLYFLPGDIGLHVKLDDFNVHCFVEGDFVDCKSINIFSEPAYEGSSLYFYGGHPNQQIFYDALSNKRRMGPIPLAKRTKSYVSSHE